MRTWRSFYISILLLLFCSTLFSCSNNMQKAPEPNLADHLVGWEDSTNAASAETAFSRIPSFQPLSALPLQNKTAVYWLASSLEWTAGNKGTQVLCFSSLTYVDLFLYKNGKCILHKTGGAFRKQRDLAEGDGRFWFSLPPDIPIDSCTLLLRVKHTKNYTPKFDFAILEMYDYFQWKQGEEAVELRLQGVLWIFLVYTLLCWVASRKRVYGWLLLTITAVTLYNLCPSGYFIAWFFPEAPLTGWLFNIHFVHLGMIGLYMLAIDFWQIRQQSRRLYVASMTAVGSIVLFTIITFYINFFYGNYALSTFLNLWTYVVHLCFGIFVIWRFWRRLDPTQRYLAYGLFVFIAAVIFSTVRIFILKEQALVNITYLSSIMIISIFLLLSTGITKSLQRTEKEKQLALENLNRLQEHQNIILEDKVKQQTAVLNDNNIRLTRQNKVLEDKNNKIAILINELNHRVKNNLQLLYSLISLQLPGIKDDVSREILKSNIGRIKAMILVNRRFYQLEELQLVELGDLTKELAANIKQIYSTQVSVSIRVDFEEGIQLDSRNALYFSLVLSELLTNSFKYAFSESKTGIIDISAIKKEHVIICRYADNGAGPQQSSATSSSIGLSLVKDLVRQMNGQLSEIAGDGFVYELTFPFRS